jgi:hypothetical protein
MSAPSRSPVIKPMFGASGQVAIWSKWAWHGCQDRHLGRLPHRPPSYQPGALPRASRNCSRGFPSRNPGGSAAGGTMVNG